MKELSTRDRILDVAADLLERHGHGVSLVDIAKASDVSRQTLYLLFGDRLGLMTALWQRNLEHEPAMRAFAASVSLPPLLAFDGFFRNWIRASIRLEGTMRWIWTMEDQDPAVLKTIRDADEIFRGHCQQVFEALKKANYLRSIWTVSSAVDAAWQSTMYLVFVGHVRSMRNLSPAEIEENGVSLLRAAFLNERALEEGIVSRPTGKGATRKGSRQRNRSRVAR
jgi:AcrR family transcriptional regulator